MLLIIAVICVKIDIVQIINYEHYFEHKGDMLISNLRTPYINRKYKKIRKKNRVQNFRNSVEPYN